MPPTALPGIFCLEGEWDPDLRVRDSVQPLLDLLERLSIARTIHRDVATREELRYYLAKWKQKRYRNYPVLYLTSHGESGCLKLGKETIDLTELGAMLKGAAKGRVIYFGSCMTLNESDVPLKDFA
jgi:hypothetical protein